MTPTGKDSAVRSRYNRLIKRFGQAGIDSILCPCWDRCLVLYAQDGAATRPYADFIDNMDWFEEVVAERE